MNLGTGDYDFRHKKAFEISYALFRISPCLKSRGLAEQLEIQASNLLAKVTQKDCQSSENTLLAIEYLIRLGSETGFIHPENGQLIINEIRVLKALVLKKEDKPVNLEEINMIFSPETDSSEVMRKNAETNAEIKRKNEEMSGEIMRKNAEIDREVLKNKEENAETNAEISAEERQKKIIDKVKQVSSCRLGDIIELFPNLSDRTIRNDLQNLIEKDIIEKMGSFGPSVYYRVKKNEISGLPAAVEVKDSNF